MERVTNMTDENVFEYVDLIEKANPDFVHVKGFMSVGYARERLGYDKQPWHKDVREFAGKIVQVLNRRRGVNKKSWKILGEEERSCVVLIGRDEKMLKIERA